MIDGNCCFPPRLRSLAFACVLSCLAAAPSSAQVWHPNSEEQNLLNDVRYRVRQCQLKEGAITRNSYGETEIPAEVDPWTGNRAVLALLRESRQYPDPRITVLSLDWLKWCTQQQVAATGMFRRLRGMVTRDQTLENTIYVRCENDAAAAASYLLLAERMAVNMAGHRTEKVTTKACERCLEFLQRCREDDFYWTFAPEWVPYGKTPSRTLLDNIEVYQGLAAAERFFRRVGDAPRAEEASEMASSLAARFPDYWNGQAAYFHHTPDDSPAKRQWGAHSLPTEARHNLMALALFDNFPAPYRARLWNQLKSQCGEEFEKLTEIDDEVVMKPPVDWMCLAARRVAPKTETDRIYVLYRLEAQNLLSRLRKPIPRVKDPNDAREWVEYDQRRQQALPSIDRIAFISHTLYSQGKFAPEQGFPTIELRWPEPPAVEMGKAEGAASPPQSVRREQTAPRKR